MSAMMSLGQDEMGEIAALAVSQTPDSKRSTILLSFDGVEGLPDLSIAGKKGSTKSSLVPKPTGMVLTLLNTRDFHSRVRRRAREQKFGAKNKNGALSCPALPAPHSHLGDTVL
ncbi:hypothetical protein FRACYDRAFT_256772 [Fragilariopsis cylindrus CCMP1102]|uniref:Uncharacterized protein n=1 Tax=Fragilariopsis cylindrus CCMP1102 TaxID=635003 RepID=A0A1E7EKG6_9STRA|nr:hypothetical protein FRACYDRAFT_256772 [Fragilariopsis cylindrus CCMP1102]|eukprot:OEU06023.1 hypothetical protein FRACYDRAFT_256772 [Fragilariopsis cylindrus CCMP1102]